MPYHELSVPARKVKLTNLRQSRYPSIEIKVRFILVQPPISSKGNSIILTEYLNNDFLWTQKTVMSFQALNLDNDSMKNSQSFFLHFLDRNIVINQ